MKEQQPRTDDGRPGDRLFLWRGVPLKPSHIVPDRNTGTFRVSSGAFDDPEMSVVVAEEEISVECLTKGSEDYGVVAFRAGDARNGMKQVVIHDPWEKEPSHALVIGEKERRACRWLAARVRWAHRPGDHDPRSLPDPTELD